MAFRIVVTLGAGLAAWALGYWLARYAGDHALCAAGRSPSSLGIMLGIASLLAVWSYTQDNTATTLD